MTRKSFKRGQDGFITALALFLFCLAPVKAHAGAGQHGIGLGVGQVLLMGDFAENFSDSIGGHFDYSYEASDMFGLLASFGISGHSNSSGTNNLSIKSFQPNLRVNLAYFDKLCLYTFGGFGLYKVDESLGAISGSVVTFGLNLGTGFLLELDRHFQFGSSIAFNNIFNKSDTATAAGNGSKGMSIGGTYLGIFLNAYYLF